MTDGAGREWSCGAHEVDGHRGAYFRVARLTRWMGAEERRSLLAGGGDGMNTAVGRGEGAPGSAPAKLDQFGGDRDRGLLGGAGSEIQADR